MFYSPEPRVITSDEGFSVTFYGLTGIHYTQGQQTLFVDSELLLSNGIMIALNDIKKWDSGETIDEETRKEIADNITRAFNWKGFEVEVPKEPPVFYSPSPDVITSDEGFSIVINGPSNLRYMEGNKSLNVDTKVMDDPQKIMVHLQNITKWNDGEPINETKKEQIIYNVDMALFWKGYKEVLDYWEPNAR
jgi:hypothetical protein